MKVIHQFVISYVHYSTQELILTQCWCCCFCQCEYQVKLLASYCCHDTHSLMELSPS
jgi:hypothetical protein